VYKKWQPCFWRSQRERVRESEKLTIYLRGVISLLLLLPNLRLRLDLLRVEAPVAIDWEWVWMVVVGVVVWLLLAFVFLRVMRFELPRTPAISRQQQICQRRERQHLMYARLAVADIRCWVH